MIIAISTDPVPRCLEALAAIEEAADALFQAQGIRFAEPAPDASPSVSAGGYYVIAADGAPQQAIRFAHLIESDGFAHLEQLSVHPDHSRRGHGRALVEAAVSEAARRGHSEMTLRTYDRIPWNRPFYESCGFSVVAPPQAPLFDRILTAEHAHGLSDHGTRVFMRRSWA